MKSKRLAGAGQRERRAFSAEFKAEAVRLVVERRAVGVTLAEVGRELDVRPDQLRAWTRQARHGSGTGGAVPGESVEQEVRRAVFIQPIAARCLRSFMRKCGAPIDFRARRCASSNAARSTMQKTSSVFRKFSCFMWF